MSGSRHKHEGRWAWRLTGFVTVCVYIFMFAPIVATVILSFNASMFGGFPMTGLSLQWYGKLFQNDAVLRAFKTSIWIALLPPPSAPSSASWRRSPSPATSSAASSS